MLSCQRDLFEIDRDVAYFDCAKMSPLLREAADAGVVGLRRKMQPWEITSAHFFNDVEATRDAYARLLATPSDNIALVPAASYGLAVASADLPVSRGQHVVLLQADFPSVALTAMALCRDRDAQLITVDRDPIGGWTPRLLDAIRPGTAVVFAPNVHWADGGVIDLHAVSARCRDVGAALVLDTTQSLGALPLDLTAIDPDFMVAAGYKWLFGPYALGLLHVAPRHHGGRPLEQGWSARLGAHDFRRLVPYREEWAQGARRFDMGERANFALLPAARVAANRLADWTPAAISGTLAAATARLADRLEPLGIRDPGAATRAPHFLCVERDGGWPDDTGDRLAAANVHVSLRGDSMRITPHVYNDGEDESRLVSALSQI